MREAIECHLKRAEEELQIVSGECDRHVRVLCVQYQNAKRRRELGKLRSRLAITQNQKGKVEQLRGMLVAFRINHSLP